MQIVLHVYNYVMTAEVEVGFVFWRFFYSFQCNCSDDAFMMHVSFQTAREGTIVLQFVRRAVLLAVSLTWFPAHQDDRTSSDLQQDQWKQSVPPAGSQRSNWRRTFS